MEKELNMASSTKCLILSAEKELRGIYFLPIDELLSL
jgi:hypothetical protein